MPENSIDASFMNRKNFFAWECVFIFGAAILENLKKCLWFICCGFYFINNMKIDVYPFTYYN